ncbi:hypothetical protein B0I35DRAFT_482812 [Stachybotrys elegans]|uniref:Protein kinase domain-containing protein n=1 Tax=Stachybotrys elegans TaxID=80388 RepID=A0A8K0SMU7_9HYPO|nr:hypothetical protein B0I35DRAFT_482812 [Stachybotrys elegans]
MEIRLLTKPTDPSIGGQSSTHSWCLQAALRWNPPLSPELEADRLWHEPEVLIYNNSIFPGVSCTASAYDVANRRWYELNVDSVVRDEDDWMSEVITKHITKYHSQHGTLPDFNVINTDRDCSETSFGRSPNAQVARPIQGNFRYGQGDSDMLPTTTFDQVKQKTYLSCSSDRCVWNAIDCVFKLIEFSEDVEVIEREVRTREMLLKAMSEAPGADSSMQKRFHILPILAVVLKHAETTETLGILMPYGGTSLESLAGGYKHGMGYRADDGEEDEEGLGASPRIDHGGSSEAQTCASAAAAGAKPLPTLPITETQIQGLVLAVWELARVGVLHGDINDRNTLLTPQNDLVMVDLGEVAPFYKGDANALGKMITWALESVDWDPDVMKRVRVVAECLQGISENKS